MGTVIMPKMGDAMEEGTLLKWLKAAGDEVAEGDPIAEIETDKVTLEIEAQESGFITNLLVDEGTVAAIGTSIATTGTQDEIGKGAPEAASVPKEEAPAAEEVAEPAGGEAEGHGQGGRQGEPAEPVAAQAAAAPTSQPDGQAAPQVADRAPA